MKFILFCAVISSVFLSSVVQSREKEITPTEYIATKGSEYNLPSTIVDQQYRIFVSTPEGYDQKPDDNYPVVYVLDGQWDFSLIINIMSKINYDQKAPQAIIAAISWQGDVNEKRSRDFTPTSVPFATNSGGANKFLSVLQKEVIPFVEKNYRTNSHRTILGASLGGLFATYAMLEKPELFSGVVALAPSYPHATAYLNEQVSKIKKSKQTFNTKFYLACGSLDFCGAATQQFADMLNKNNIEGLSMNMQMIAGVGHAGISTIGYTYGLQYVFEREKAQLSPAILKRYAGRYVADQNAFSIVVEAGDNRLLTHKEGTSMAVDFFPETETKFFADGKKLSIYFTFEDETTMHMESNGKVFLLKKEK